jgi:hypothetical protein
MSPESSSATVDELVSRSAEPAAAHTETSEQGDHKLANSHHDIVAAPYRELARAESKRRCCRCSPNGDAGVRSWAAAHALELSPADGERVLEDLVAETSLISLHAQMALDIWRRGELRFP